MNQKDASMLCKLINQLAIKSISKILKLKTDLLLIRHGQARKIDLRKNRNKFFFDYDPPLTPSGKKKALDCARDLSWLEPEIGVILTSPSLRTRQTAEIIAKQINKPLSVVYDIFDCKFASCWSREKVKYILSSKHPEEQFCADFLDDIPFFLGYYLQSVAGIVRVVTAYQGKRVCLVTHGEAMANMDKFFSRDHEYSATRMPPIYNYCQCKSIELWREQDSLFTKLG